MQKQAPTIGRLFIMVAFALSCFGLLLFLWLAFGGSIPLSPKGWQFEAQFSEATNLAKQADVRISGVSVGKGRQNGRSRSDKPGNRPDDAVGNCPHIDNHRLGSLSTSVSRGAPARAATADDATPDASSYC